VTGPLLQAEHLVKHYPVRGGLLSKRSGAVRAVDGVSFEVARGETLGLVGESGCGKTTVARLVLRLEAPTAGRVSFDGEDLLALSSKALRAKRRELQIVFQDPMSSLNPRMTVGEILAEPLSVHRVATGAALDARVAALLEQVGIPASWRQRYPHEFSGGQRQRIGVARAIALGPKLVVCDEAVSALDVSVQAQVLNLLLELRERLGLAYLFISHDLSVVRHVADRVAVMYLGQLVEQAPTARLFGAPAHPYTKALLSAIPVPDPRRRRERIVLGGDVPSPANPPAGCRFHTRCPFVMARCKQEEPPAYRVGEGHEVRCFLADPGGAGPAS
jgi:oligopeptide/dipeptide ABC transporter ATP-binding protein